jgi:hypothetical protein
MKNQVKIYLKIGWLATVVTTLLMGTNMCVSTDAACYQAGETMLFMMFWLSFPTGLLFVVPAMIALEYGNVQVPSDFITAWIVMAFAGFLQWFILVPRFLQKPDLILLKLGTSPALPSPGSQDTTLPSREVISRLRSQRQPFPKHRSRSNQDLFNLSVSESEHGGNRLSRSRPLTEAAALHSKE